MRKTQVRALMASVITIIVLVIFVAIAAKMLAYDIPVLNSIADAMGF